MAIKKLAQCSINYAKHLHKKNIEIRWNKREGTLVLSLYNIYVSGVEIRDYTVIVWFEINLIGDFIKNSPWLFIRVQPLKLGNLIKVILFLSDHNIILK